MILQKLHIKEQSSFEIAEKYYTILSILNNLNLGKREIQLLAFIACTGTISLAKNKKEFCKKVGTTIQTVYKMIHNLSSKKILVKDEQINITPTILLDFQKPIVLQIRLDHDV